MAVDDYVQTLNLHINQTHRGNCPECGGYNTFVASRHYDGALTYFCFRASCSLRGVVSTSVRKSDVAEWLRRNKIAHDMISDKFEIPEYVVQTLPPDHDGLNRYLSRYPWAIDYEDVRWDVRDERLVWVMHDFKTNAVVDMVGRAVSPRPGQPKVKRYGKSGMPFVTGFNPYGGIKIVVEDVTSALRIARQTPLYGVAILGTHLQEPYIPYLTDADRVVIMLDNDATDKAMAMANKLKQYVPTIWVKLQEDLKDMGAEAFQTVMKGV